VWLAQGQVRPVLADCAERLPELIQRPKAMEAMLGMKKLTIAELERAAES